MKPGRTPQGVRGLKQDFRRKPKADVYRRTPQGVRGLKQERGVVYFSDYLSHSARSAWIETGFLFRRLMMSLVALRKECVD